MQRISILTGSFVAVLLLIVAPAALACPKKSTSTPAAPTSSTWGSFSFEQSQAVSGHVKDLTMIQTADNAISVTDGRHSAYSTNWGSQAQHFDFAKNANQYQTGTAGAAIVHRIDQMPTLITATTQGAMAGNQGGWGVNPVMENSGMHESGTSIKTNSHQGPVTTHVEGQVANQLSAKGPGDYNQSYGYNASSQGQGMGVWPFPKSHTLSLFPGNLIKGLQQTISLSNKLIF